MGSTAFYPEEGPVRRIKVSGFLMDATAVTNRDFELFVLSTGYITLAERPPNPEDYPGAPMDMLQPGSAVFIRPDGPIPRDQPYHWWSYVPGANWRQPYGPGSTIEGLESHPVVHVVHEDCVAYAHWAGKSLPTEAEWEYAARGGLDGAEFAWGDALNPGGRHLANTWQGDFPWQNQALDGHDGTAPVGCYPPNGYGLYDMIGNVWEWTSDWYRQNHPAGKSCCIPLDPRGASEEDSYDPAMPDARIPRKVLKGGSFLCAPDYCERYRPAARLAQALDTSTCHVGFRCVIRPALGEPVNWG